MKGHPGDWRPQTPSTRGLPEPPAQLPVPPDAQRIPLPPANKHIQDPISLHDAFSNRRSRREFSPDPLNLNDLAFLLWSAQGNTGELRDEKGAITNRLRTTPSAGARYPLETFLAVHNVNGLSPGIYRYLPEDHQLLAVRAPKNLRGEINLACYETPAINQAAAVFIWAAVPGRTEWKYGKISHKMIALEAGHSCQNLYLAGEDTNIGVCALLAYHQESMDALIGADGNEIFTIYLACVGNRKNSHRPTTRSNPDTREK